jgi:glycosyltransferase involved in cell wall biosynthesis/2-polyprenyl-3-methyl-5-hydroxy-6-metoxy-1,4-benzoquinol methylase
MKQMDPASSIKTTVQIPQNVPMKSENRAAKEIGTSAWPDRINQAYYGELGDLLGEKTRLRINWMCSQCKGQSVLDVGCSQGITSVLLAREGLDVTGIDISETAIEYAESERQKEIESVRNRLHFECVDLNSLGDRQFDTVVVGEVLEHQALPERFLKCAASHVRHGGRLVLTTPFGLHPYPDHKCTIFPWRILSAIMDMLQITHLSISEGYVKLVAVALPPFGTHLDMLNLALATTEHGTLESQTLYFATTEKNTAANKTILELRKFNSQQEKILSDYRRALATAERQLEKTRNSFSYRLGNSLINAPKSIRGLMQLPGKLLELRRDAKARLAERKAFPVRGQESEPESKHLPGMLDIYAANGTPAAVSFIETLSVDASERANLFTHLARSIALTTPREACEIGRRAYAEDTQPFRAKWLALFQFDCGMIQEPVSLIEKLPRDLVATAFEQNRIEQLRGWARIQQSGVAIPPRVWKTYETAPGPVLYVAASALPYHISGYTIRTQGLVEAIIGTGRQIICLTRPGYPDDRADALQRRSGDHDRVGLVTYLHASSSGRLNKVLDEYLESASATVEKVARDVNASIIHAASNYENALPALIAARRIGIPFIFEMRGLWELTKASRRAGWETTEVFELAHNLEMLICQHAEIVLAQTRALAKELVAHGVASEKIRVAPNAVNADKFSPRVPDSRLLADLKIPPGIFKLAYIGSLLDYEGLDDLLKAVALLIGRQIAVRLIIAGTGEAESSLRELAETLNLQKFVSWVGKIQPDDAVRYWSLADAAAFPRKPYKVCELVAPLKPFEAMSMGKPVIVSDLPALREVVEHERTGLLFPAGDVDELADCLYKLATDQPLQNRLGKAAREYVRAEKNWPAVARTVEMTYSELNTVMQKKTGNGHASI